LRLPGEIRNQIYAYLLIGAVDFRRKGPWDTTDPNNPYLTLVISPTWLPVLFVCR